MKHIPDTPEPIRGSLSNELPLNILMVEDNPGDVALVKELVRACGISFTFKNVRTLKETIALCAGNNYDVILLDLGLPDSVGLETLKKIQKTKVKSPVVVMTGLDDEDIALASLREGAQDYLVKNRLNSDYILRTIRYSIERKKIQELQKRYAHRFSILSAATLALNENDDIPGILKTICDNLGMLINKAHAIAFEFDDHSGIRLSGIEWLKPMFGQIRLITGWDLENPAFQASNQGQNLNNTLYNSRLHRITKGMYEIFNGILNDDQCREIESLLGEYNIYTIGFTQHKMFYGGIILFSQEIVGNDDIKIIETVCNQISLTIHRRSIEYDLRLSEFRYKRLSKELEQKVKERTTDLELLNHQLNQELTVRIQAEKALKESEARLRELNATKDKFFNIVAHDLKNPFTSLLGSSELLFQNINQLDNHNIKKLAIILNDSAKSGFAILQNLLDWSRSQTGILKFSPERINLRNLLEENIVNMELFSTNKEIEMILQVEQGMFIFADKNMINTVLRNLLSNALKFSFRCGKVYVKAFIDGPYMVISVKDSGIGIAQENIEKIFRIDTKYSKPGTENEQGTGLGLKLCKEFVEKQNGRIWVESIENKGSEFKFAIPYHES